MCIIENFNCICITHGNVCISENSLMKELKISICNNQVKSREIQHYAVATHVETQIIDSCSPLLDYRGTTRTYKTKKCTQR